MNIGYIPRIKYINIIDEIKLILNKIVYIIKNQNLIKSPGIKILNEARSIAPSGLLLSNINLVYKIEIDINKIFTKGFINIREISIFIQFDH